MKKRSMITSLSLVAAQFLTGAPSAYAQFFDPGTIMPKSCSGSGAQGGAQCIVNQIITPIANLLLGIALSIAVVFLIIGGVRYVTSAGSPTATEGAKKTIIYALVGIAIIIFAIFAVQVVKGIFT